ncbi:MAG: hypothetical protein Q8R53_03455 [Nanoarchaeota archaeon]|nr:hypothetical protein [Nanoarchaeota archaeon]
MDKIKITLETLYDCLRNEKKKEDLQKVKDSFFVDVVAYLKEKKALFDSRKEQEELFATGEREKLAYELRSIQRILKELYDKREKKVIAIALNKSRTNSDLIDLSSMLPEEKQFYQELTDTLNKYRRGILFRLWRAEAPDIAGDTALLSLPLLRREVGASEIQTPLADVTPFAAASEESNAGEGTTAKTITGETRVPELATAATTEKEKPLLQTVPEEPQMVPIRFLQPIPSFVWKDLKVYGPFDAGEETRLFPEVVDLLVRKGRAEILAHAPENYAR